MRKLFITSLIFNEFSCGEVHIHHVLVTSKRILKCSVFMHCSFLHNFEQRQNVDVFAQGCVEQYSVHGNTSQKTACYKKP